MSELRIYGGSQSRAARCLWCAEELGLKYEHVPLHYADGSTRKPDFLAINPNGHVPAIQDEDFKLWESMAINLYLAKKHGGPLQPTTLEGEALAIQWSFWVMTEVEKPLVTLLLQRVVVPEDKRDPALMAACVKQLQAPLKVLNDAVANNRRYLLGPDFTIADLNVASVMAWAKMAKVDLSAYPAAADWLGRCLARPAQAVARQRK